MRCMRACVHAYMRACIHAHMHTCVYACMRICVHAYMRACVHSYMRAYAYTSAFITVCMHAYMCMCMSLLCVCQLQAQGLRPDVLTYTSLLSAYGRAGKAEEAQAVFRDMVACRIR